MLCPAVSDKLSDAQVAVLVTETGLYKLATGGYLHVRKNQSAQNNGWSLDYIRGVQMEYKHNLECPLEKEDAQIQGPLDYHMCTASMTIKLN